MLDTTALVIALQSAGIKKIKVWKDEVKFCCPFHADRTPSAFLNVSKVVYKCFSCGRGESAYSFLHLIGIQPYSLEIESIVDFVSSKVNKVVQKRKSKTYDQFMGRVVSQSMQEGLLIWEQSVPTFTVDPVEEYIKNRTGNAFTPIPVAYHPQRYSLVFKTEFNIVERFFKCRSQKITVPSMVYGEKHLFTHDFKSKSDTVYLVEGLFDYLNLYQAGFKNCAALLGSSVSDINQVEIDSLGEDVTLIPDSDKAGLNSLKPNAKKLTELGKRVYVIYPKPEKDFGAMTHEQIRENIFNGRTAYGNRISGGNLEDCLSRFG